METSQNGSHSKQTEDNSLPNVDHGNLQKPEEKNSGLLKKIESLRMSKKNLKKPNEEGELNFPDKHESPLGKDHNGRGSKIFGNRQSHIDKSESSEKTEPFASLVSRLSKKSPNKTEKKENHRISESKESPEGASSLVDKLRRSMRGKKKLDFTEVQKSFTPEEPKQEEEEEEHQMLSVMEINGLIQHKNLKKAFLNIKLMEDKLLEECRTNNFHENATEYTIRGKDVDLLYGSLFNLIRSIVKDSLCQEIVDESIISSVVYVINKEAEIHKNPVVTPADAEIPLLGKPRRWKRLWKEAVKDSVSKRVESVPLKEEENGWLPKHLLNLESIIVEDLKKVKNFLRPLYPEDYDVCGTYMRSFHEALASHLQTQLIPLALEFSQLYCLLDWIINQYKSDDLLGNPDLQANIDPLSLCPLLEGECLEKLKGDYNQALQKTIRTYMNNILEIEKNNWNKGEEVEESVLEDSCHLPIYTDIEEVVKKPRQMMRSKTGLQDTTTQDVCVDSNHIIGTHVRNSAKLSVELEISTSNSCVEELGMFTTRLQAAFKDCVGISFSDLFVQYTVVYVNSFTKLRHNTTQSDAEQYRCAEIKLDEAIKNLKDHLLHLFTYETKPYFQKLITKNWLKKNTAFNTIMKSTGILRRFLKYLLPPHDKDFAHAIHHYLVKEYISQIMKRKMRLNNLRRKKAAQKMQEEGDLINKAVDDMGSDLDSLHHAIYCISEIICAKKKDEIKPKLDELYYLYPDISEDHILCILHLHGIGRNMKLLGHFQKLQDSQQPNSSLEDSQRPRLFSDIPCSTQVACFTF